MQPQPGLGLISAGTQDTFQCCPVKLLHFHHQCICNIASMCRDGECAFVYPFPLCFMSSHTWASCTWPCQQYPGAAACTSDSSLGTREGESQSCIFLYQQMGEAREHCESHAQGTGRCLCAVLGAGLRAQGKNLLGCSSPQQQVTPPFPAPPFPAF